MIRTDDLTITVRVEIGLKNVGERAAQETVLNVIVPRVFRNFRWSGSRGEVLPEVRPPSIPRRSTDAEGVVHVSHYLDKTIARVTRRTHYVTFVVLNVNVPRSGVKSVPVRVTAEADELPDDDPEESELLMVRVTRRTATDPPSLGLVGRPRGCLDSQSHASSAASLKDTARYGAPPGTCSPQWRCSGGSCLGSRS